MNIKSSWLYVGILCGLFFIASGIFFLCQLGSPLRSSSKGAVGVVELSTLILDSKKTLADLEQFEEDDHIKAVVLRLNSPGGAVAPSQEIYEAVRRYSKPLVVSMGAVAASGAYYIACGSKKIFANPGTLTGSIGVLMEFVNLQKFYEWAKIQRYVIKTGQFKDSGSEYRAMNAVERQLLQTVANDILEQFKTAVSLGRHLKMKEVSVIADGRIFSGHQALKLHLVDELGSLWDAIQEAGQLGSIQGKPSVIYIQKKKRHFFDYFFDDFSLSQQIGKSFQTNKNIMEWFFSKWESISDASGARPHFIPGVYAVWGSGL